MNRSAKQTFYIITGKPSDPVIKEVQALSLNSDVIYFKEGKQWNFTCKHTGRRIWFHTGTKEEAIKMYMKLCDERYKKIMYEPSFIRMVDQFNKLVKKHLESKEGESNESLHI